MIPLLLAFLLASPARAVWMNVRVDSMDRRVMCATQGIFDSEPMMVLCGENGPLYIYRWSGFELRRQTIESGFNYPNAAVFADLRGDGIQRLYVGSSLNKGIMEFSPDGFGGFKRERLRIDAQVVSMAIAYSMIEKKTLLALKSWEAIPQKNPSGDYLLKWETQVCGVEGGSFDCKTIGGGSGGPLFLLGKPGVDVLMSNPRHVRERGRGWSTISVEVDPVTGIEIADNGKPLLPGRRSEPDVIVRRNLTRSAVQENVFYTDKAEYRMDDSFRRTVSSHPIDGGLNDAYSTVAYGAHEMPNLGSLRAILPHRLKPGVQERLLISKMDDKLYEFTRLRDAWRKTEEIGWYPLSPDYLFAADMRGDGRRRVYLVGNGPVSHRDESGLWELDYFPRKLVVAVLDVSVEAGEKWKEGAQEILGDLLRSEIAAARHLSVIDEEKQDGILAERALRKEICEDEACLAEIGKLLKAEVVVKTSISRKSGQLSLTTQAVAADGRTLFKFERPGIATQDALDAVRAIGRSWSQLLSSEVIGPAK